MDILALLKEYAAEIGIDGLGVCTVEGLAPLAPILRERQARDLLPPWLPPQWAQAHRPEVFLSGARSLISIAISYGRPAPQRSPKSHGIIARYAWGPDYHPYLREKLDSLAHFLAREKGGRSLAAVDTGPTIDRYAAYQGGLGWYGKNNCLYVKPFGSWVVLGVLITDVELSPQEPLPSLCGHCKRCIQACPTGALKPYQLDYRRCIAYLTQMKEPIPLELRPAMANYIGGCDLCQQACPYNQKAQLPAHPWCQPVPDGVYPPLDILLAMDEKRWRMGLGRTALGWRGRRTLQRNALIAAGNLRDESLRPLVLKALEDPRPMIRTYAQWALEQMSG
ncbi:MAG: tRNA epoxyqueuosine(34) reductase QueG [Limnochordia bacterium]|jgi:epoxyqueuosine reductase